MKRDEMWAIVRKMFRNNACTFTSQSLSEFLDNHPGTAFACGCRAKKPVFVVSRYATKTNMALHNLIFISRYKVDPCIRNSGAL